EVARGNAGAAALIGPSSFMIWFTIPRAGRPVKMLVRAVWRGGPRFLKGRWTPPKVALGNSQYSAPVSKPAGPPPHTPATAARTPPRLRAAGARYEGDFHSRHIWRQRGNGAD